MTDPELLVALRSWFLEELRSPECYPLHKRERLAELFSAVAASVALEALVAATPFDGRRMSREEFVTRLIDWFITVIEHPERLTTAEVHEARELNSQIPDYVQGRTHDRLKPSVN